MVITHWDLMSLFVYLFCALVGMICFKGVMGLNTKPARSVIFTKSALFLLFFWGIISTFRLVANGIGGTDAIGYVYDFEHALIKNYMTSARDGSTDYFYMAVVYAIRSLTSDYHVYFAIIYGLISISFILFVSKFSQKKFSIIPFFMVFYIYLRGFNTLRSVFALSLILLALYCLTDKKYWLAYLFVIFSLFTHKSALVFAIVVPLCHVLANKKVGIFYMIAALVVVFFTSAIINKIFVDYTSGMDIGGSYNSYASREDSSFLASSTEFYGIYLLGITMIIYARKLRKRIDKMGDENTRRIFNILYIICMYDVAIGPFNAFMGIWRGYEFFYVARMCMWSMIIYMFTEKLNKTMSFLVKGVIFVCFAGWFIFRLSRTYEDSDLMPYVFEPFMYFLTI